MIHRDAFAQVFVEHETRVSQLGGRKTKVPFRFASNDASPGGRPNRHAAQIHQATGIDLRRAERHRLFARL